MSFFLFGRCINREHLGAHFGATVKGCSNGFSQSMIRETCNRKTLGSNLLHAKEIHPCKYTYIYEKDLLRVAAVLLSLHPATLLQDGQGQLVSQYDCLNHPSCCRSAASATKCGRANLEVACSSHEGHSLENYDHPKW